MKLARMLWLVAPMVAASGVAQGQTAARTGRDTTIVLGVRERDLTGDGKPETLRLVGVGRSIDTLQLTFTIESAGQVLLSESHGAITRRIGYDADRSVRSAAQQRAFIRDYGGWFFDPRKFMTPDDFMKKLLQNGTGGGEYVREIPERIAESRGGDTVVAKAIWDDARRRRLTVFEYSPGGDTIEAIVWSDRDGRFVRLISCC